MIFLPTWLEAGFGFTALMIAALYLVGGVGTIYAGPRAGVLSDRIGRRTVILWSSLGLIVFVLLMPALVGLAALVAFPAFLAVNVFLSARASAFQAMLTELVGTPERGSLMSLTTAAGQLGFASGAAVAGPTFAGYGFDGNAAITAIAAALAGGVVWWFIPGATTRASAQRSRMPVQPATDPARALRTHSGERTHGRSASVPRGHGILAGDHALGCVFVPLFLRPLRSVWMKSEGGELATLGAIGLSVAPIGAPRCRRGERQPSAPETSS